MNQRKQEKAVLIGSAFYAAAFLVGLPAAAIISNQDIISHKDQMGVRKNGTAYSQTMTLGAITDYDFKNHTMTLIVPVPKAGIAIPFVKSANEFTERERTGYNQVQEEACALAAGRKGYSDVCVGLNSQPS